VGTGSKPLQRPKSLRCSRPVHLNVRGDALCCHRTAVTDEHTGEIGPPHAIEAFHALVTFESEVGICSASASCSWSLIDSAQYSCSANRTSRRRSHWTKAGLFLFKHDPHREARFQGVSSVVGADQGKSSGRGFGSHRQAGSSTNLEAVCPLLPIAASANPYRVRWRR
jgi:hypothetical protein